jgi:hypothetical protein
VLYPRGTAVWPRPSAWRCTVPGLKTAIIASSNAWALAEWSPPKLHTYTSSVTALLGPRVHAQVRLGQQHRGSHPARPQPSGRESVKQLGDCLQARRPHGLYAMLAQARCIGQPRGIALALVQVGGQVESLHGAYFRALLPTFGRAWLAR